MLWVDEESTLPNNYFSALVQMKSLERRFGKDPQLKESYSKTINDDFEKGYIVQVDKSECFRTDNRREWYLLHHPVIHLHKPGKMRRVLNDVAKFHGFLLNNALLTGPDLLQSLIHIIFRFRQYPNAVSADIEGMFLQVEVIPKHQPSIRFFVARGSINRSFCVSIRQTHLWFEGLSDLRKIRFDENRNRQR